MANARELTLKALYSVEVEGTYSNQALKTLLGQKDLPREDRGFVTELLLGVVRNKLFLDYVISRFSSVRLKKLSPWIHGILRLGVYQVVCMERIPDSAACNEMVKLAGKYSRGASKGFVNGVLRTVSREKDRIPYPDDQTEAMSVRYSCPLWLTEKLLSQYGAETEEILAATLKPYPVSLRVNTLKTDKEELQKRLLEEGVRTYPHEKNDRCLYVDGGLNVEQSPAYRDGLYTLQNISSMTAVEWLAPLRGERVLDLCAAPGGKTTYMGERMENTGKIVACDIHPHKIPLLTAAAERLGLTIVETVCLDATELSAEWMESFDCVLADVPCSGIGVIHKKPDIKWNRNAEDVDALAEVQEKILNNAATYVKAGGRLVYSTCTILQEENGDQIAKFLKTHPEFVLEKEETLFIHKTGGSGFYIAKLIRK
ncbi:MAG: 16S rRNA (cytosine(967)-C(5))-methyltransferase RsmB [Clostridia bacterium]|nr:16S rRNA (cytosine(967)-C(5))-methyltransferase RsmB [Clostridia bacterium]